MKLKKVYLFEVLVNSISSTKCCLIAKKKVFLRLLKDHSTILFYFLVHADQLVSETFETFVPRSHYHTDHLIYQ